MLTPTDSDILSSMTDPAFFANIPASFIEEYDLRLGMLCRAGLTIPGLGAMALMQLCRDMKVSAEVRPANTAITNWRELTEGTRVDYQGRRGTFKGLADGGMVYIQLDGYRATHEVRGVDCTLPPPLVAEVPNAVFERDPETVLSTVEQAVLQDNAPRVPGRPEQGKVGKSDELFAKWQHVDAGDEVMFEDGEEVLSGRFVDVEGDDKISLLVDGLPRIIPADKAVVPEKELASA